MSEFCENCGTPAIYELEGELGRICQCTLMSLFEENEVSNQSVTNDNVNHPLHYTAHPLGIEAIQITRHMNFNLGNAMKYIWKAGLKDSAIQDLEKAVFYLNDEIARLGGTPARQEKERAIRIAQRVALTRHEGLVGDYLYLADFIEYINDESEQ